MVSLYIRRCSGVGSKRNRIINGRQAKRLRLQVALSANCQRKMSAKSERIFFSMSEGWEFNSKTVNWVSVLLPLTRISLLSFAWGRLTTQPNSSLQGTLQAVIWLRSNGPSGIWEPNAALTGAGCSAEGLGKSVCVGEKVLLLQLLFHLHKQNLWGQ